MQYTNHGVISHSLEESRALAPLRIAIKAAGIYTSDRFTFTMPLLFEQVYELGHIHWVDQNEIMKMEVIPIFI